jgi:Flp pilus assembly protein TadD
LLRQAIRTDDALLPAYELLGRVFLSQNRLDEARAEFERLATKDRKPVAALTMSGMILESQGRINEARQSYERVLELDPRAAVAANNLAWLYAETGGNLDVALQHAQTAKAVLPDQAQVNDTLGWIYYKKDLLPLAISALQRSIEIDGKNPLFLYHLGLAYAKNGYAAQAKQTFERCLALNPDFERRAEIRDRLASLGS